MKKGGKSKIQTSRTASHVEHNFCITVAKKWLILTPNLVILWLVTPKNIFFLPKEESLPSLMRRDRDHAQRMSRGPRPSCCCGKSTKDQCAYTFCNIVHAAFVPDCCCLRQRFCSCFRERISACFLNSTELSTQRRVKPCS